MKRAYKSDVYKFILDKEEVKAMDIAVHFDCELSLVNGILSKLRRDGKIIKIHGKSSKDVTTWRPNPQYYIIGKSRAYERT